MKKDKRIIMTIYFLSLLVIILSCKKTTDPNPSDPIVNNPDTNSINELKENLCNNGLVTGTFLEQVALNGNITKFHYLYEYEFNSKNQLSKVDQKYVGDYNNGLIRRYKYSYNDDGYLISKIQELENDRQIAGRLVATSEFYEYSSGRLSKITYKYKSRESDGRIETSEATASYRYDSNGRITSNGEDEFEYDANGNVISYRNPQLSNAYTIQDGRIERVDIGNGEYFKYSYGSNGSLSKEEIWSDGKVFAMRELIWDNKKRNINILTGISDHGYEYQNFGHQMRLAESVYHIYFKGWPEYPKLMGKDTKNNLISINDIFYLPGNSIKFQSYSHELQYHSSGFPISGEKLTKELYMGKVQILDYNLHSSDYCFQ